MKCVYILEGRPVSVLLLKVQRISNFYGRRLHVATRPFTIGSCTVSRSQPPTRVRLPGDGHLGVSSPCDHNNVVTGTHVRILLWILASNSWASGSGVWIDLQGTHLVPLSIADWFPECPLVTHSRFHQQDMKVPVPRHLTST